jgi:hypothetical protein
VRLGKGRSGDRVYQYIAWIAICLWARLESLIEVFLTFVKNGIRSCRSSASIETEPAKFLLKGKEGLPNVCEGRFLLGLEAKDDNSTKQPYLCTNITIRLQDYIDSLSRGLQ